MDERLTGVIAGLPNGDIAVVSREELHTLEPPEPLREVLRLGPDRIAGLGRDCAFVLSVSDGRCWSFEGVTHLATFGARLLGLRDGHVGELKTEAQDEESATTLSLPAVCFENPAPGSTLFATEHGAFLREGAELRVALWTGYTAKATKLSDKYMQVAMFDCGPSCPIMVLCRNALVAWNPKWTVMALRADDALDLRELPVYVDGELWLLRRGKIDKVVAVTSFHGPHSKQAERVSSDASAAVFGPFVYFSNGAILPRRAQAEPEAAALPVPFPVSWIA